jgi:hypothetical protein
MFVTKDDQSSAMFAIGARGHNKTEEDIARMHEGAKVVKSEGKINGTKVEWWRWEDSHHLYSCCAFTLSYKEGTAQEFFVDLVANEPERLAALEKSFSTLEFI